MQVFKGVLLFAAIVLLVNTVAADDWSSTYDSLFGTGTSRKSPDEAKKLLTDLKRMMTTVSVSDHQKDEIKFWDDLDRKPDAPLCSGSLDSSIEQRSKGHPGLEEYATKLQDDIFKKYCGKELSWRYRFDLLDWSETDKMYKIIDGVELNKPMSEELWEDNVYALLDDTVRRLRDAVFKLDKDRATNYNEFIKWYRIRSACHDPLYNKLVENDEQKEFWSYVSRPKIWKLLKENEQMVFEKVRKCQKINALESSKLLERVFERLYAKAKSPIEKPKDPKDDHLFRKIFGRIRST